MLRPKTLLIGMLSATLLALAPGDDPELGERASWRAFSKDPTDRESIRRILAGFDEMGNTEAEERFLLRALELAPSEPLLIERLAYAILLPQRRHKEAIDVFTRLGKRFGNRNAVVATVLYDAYGRLGDDDAALRYARIAATNDEHPRYELALARFTADLGNGDEAQEALGRATEKLKRLTPSLSPRESIELSIDIDRETVKTWLDAGDVAKAKTTLATLDARLANLRTLSAASKDPAESAALTALALRVEAECAPLRSDLAH